MSHTTQFGKGNCIVALLFATINIMRWKMHNSTYRKGFWSGGGFSSAEKVTRKSEQVICPESDISITQFLIASAIESH